MEVNQKKTKVMIFTLSRKKNVKSGRWKIGDLLIEEASSYKYLGVTIRNNGTFGDHITAVKEKVNKALYALIGKSIEWQGFNPQIFMHAFNLTIVPILNYGAEIWGGNEWYELEKIHLYACKFTLGVKQSTTTDSIYAEMGRYPLFTCRKIAIIKYINRLKGLSDERLAKKAFKQMCLDDIKGHYNWFSRVNDMLKDNSINYNDPNEVIKKKIKETFQKQLKGNLHEAIVNEKKLRTYARFKTIHNFESYLYKIQSFKRRSYFTRFRLGVHDLEIEKGRYSNIQKELRFCRSCITMKIQAVEDELHFLLHCPFYMKERDFMLQKIEQRYPNVKILSDENKFIWIMSQEDDDCIQWVATYIHKAMEKRSVNVNNILIKPTN